MPGLPAGLLNFPALSNRSLELKGLTLIFCGKIAVKSIKSMDNQKWVPVAAHGEECDFFDTKFRQPD